MTNTSNVPVKKKIRSIFNTVSNYFLEFSNSTTIHGFKFLVETRRLKFERLWWLTILAICTAMCVNLIALTLKKWEENPVFISYSQEPLNLWNIPFPAVTVCPEAKLDRTNEPSQEYFEGKKEVMDATLLCGRGGPVRFKNHTVDLDTVDAMIDKSLGFKDVIWHLGSKGLWPAVSKELNFFSPTLTENGVCYTSNMLDKDELYTDITYFHTKCGRHRQSIHWNPDSNFEKTKNDTIPIRMKTTVTHLLMYLFTNETHEDLSCSFSKGFKVILHHPAEPPLFSTQSVSISAKTNYEIYIKPRILTTSSSLRKYHPRKRKCYFSDEKKLKYFKIYMQKNCQIECIANYISETCGCSPYYMPREATAKICGLEEVECATAAFGKIQELEMEMSLENAGKDKLCDCLPSCNYITYEKEISLQNSFEKPSRINMRFHEVEIPTMERRELFSSTDFWASCGGLLGLFTGFSVISLSEIVYFLSLRWICNLWRLRKAAKGS